MLGIVILNYNDSENASNLANHVKKYSNVGKVFIIDNCSTDGSIKTLKNRFDKDSKVQVLQTERNGGYAYGNNYGIKALKASGEDIALVCNTDVEFTEKFADACIDALKHGYSMVSGLMKNSDGSKMFTLNYKISEYKDDLKNCFFIGRKIGERKKKKELNLKTDKKIIRDVELLPGSLFVVNIDDFFDVGGLDENTFLYCEERILGRRMERSGKKIGLLMYVDYLHIGSSSISKSYNDIYKRVKLLYQSRMYYQKTYNEIGIVKFIILKAAMSVSLLEYKIRDFLKKIKR